MAMTEKDRMRLWITVVVVMFVVILWCTWLGIMSTGIYAMQSSALNNVTILTNLTTQIISINKDRKGNYKIEVVDTLGEYMKYVVAGLIFVAILLGVTIIYIVGTRPKPRLQYRIVMVETATQTPPSSTSPGEQSSHAPSLLPAATLTQETETSVRPKSGNTDVSVSSTSPESYEMQDMAVEKKPAPEIQVQGTAVEKPSPEIQVQGTAVEKEPSPEIQILDTVAFKKPAPEIQILDAAVEKKPAPEIQMLDTAPEKQPGDTDVDKQLDPEIQPEDTDVQFHSALEV